LEWVCWEEEWVCWEEEWVWWEEEWVWYKVWQGSGRGPGRMFGLGERVKFVTTVQINP